jgi:hypothetical protein
VGPKPPKQTKIQEIANPHDEEKKKKRPIEKDLQATAIPP